MTSVKRAAYYLLYYLGTRWLPPSSGPGGPIWRWLRFQTCRPLFAYCGKNVNVERKAYFGSGARVAIGSGSGIGIGCSILGDVAIGENVMMGPDVTILTFNHRFDRTDIPMSEQGHTESRPVAIQDDVWIGTRAIILPGVVIERGAIVGAGAVVTKRVPAFAIAAGNPARVVKTRSGAVPLPSPGARNVT